MAHLLKPNISKYHEIKPKNGNYFTRDEVYIILKSKRLNLHQILNHSGRTSPFYLIYNPDERNIQLLNYLATREYITGMYKESDFVYYMARLRLNKQSFIDNFKNVTYICGVAMVGTASEFNIKSIKNIKDNYD